MKDMQANLSDAELSEKLKPLNKKVKIFFTLDNIFIKLMLFLAAVSILLGFFDMPKFGAILFVCSAFPSTFLAIIFKKMAVGYGEEMVRLTRNMAEGMLKNNFDLKAYYPDSYISREEVHNAKLFNWNGIDGYNRIHANYQDADFVFSDLGLTLYMQNKPYDVFTGKWLVITMSKNDCPNA
jgi:hypothetical protein